MSNYNSTLQSNNTDLQAILNTINELPNAGGEQATPVISVNSANGLITATAGAKTSTHQLAFQAAKTITPSTTSQTAVSSGYYTGGNITVASVPTQTKTVTPTSTTQNITPDSGKFLSKVTINGDSDLVAGNIKSGVNIFGVTGTYEGSGGSGGDTSIADDLVMGTLEAYESDRITTIHNYAFYSQSKLTSVKCPQVVFIGSYAFGYCSSLISAEFPVCSHVRANAFASCPKLNNANFPACKHIEDYAFMNCYKLSSINITACSFIGSIAFRRCSSLTSVELPNMTGIASSAFADCVNLQSIYLTNTQVCTLSNSNAFSNTGIWSNKGSIFVPSSLVASYKTARHWSFFSNRIFSA